MTKLSTHCAASTPAPTFNRLKREQVASHSWHLHSCALALEFVCQGANFKSFSQRKISRLEHGTLRRCASANGCAPVAQHLLLVVFGQECGVRGAAGEVTPFRRSHTLQTYGFSNHRPLANRKVRSFRPKRRNVKLKK